MTQPVEILLIEDSPGDVALTRKALKRAKLLNNLHVATDGEQALEMLFGDDGEMPRPDLILLDLNLPRIDGSEVLEKVKADPRTKSIPVVVLTTSDADEDILRSYELHANCYITKPVDLVKFLDIVHNIEHFWLQIAKLPNKQTP